MTDVTLTFPDGAQRKSRQGYYGPRGRQGHLSVAGQAHRRHAARRRPGRPRRPHHQGRDDQLRLAHRSGRAGADPARRRARDGGSRAGAVARHAGDDRPGDRERLLLRLRQGRAVPSRTISARSKRRCTRSSPRTRPSPRRSGRATRRRRRLRARWASTSRSSSSTRSPKARTSRSTSRASGSTSAAART